ncbi:sigma factor-like helix-turn-helix DNA-binding protein [uncultured Brevundimonas sp.]|uniref:RNA polymerase sigma factor n=1 Tax=uncultured Brevundimonas sp. TaxID=213418 RepID=UPI0025D61BC1|nr:sigma factor-like helix-turn-helix DNA-binding protein [uncultured Brevundimonas sp.]
MSGPPSHSTEEARERQILIRAMQRLPRRYRDFFVLHRFAEMPLELIAEHLGIETRVVETRLAAALVRLSRAVDDANGGEASEGS